MMNMKLVHVKVTDLCDCDDCDWNADGVMDEGNISTKCQQHANKTGHHVHREMGYVTHYEPKTKE